MTLQQALDELANLTPDQIAAKLTEAGIRCQRDSAVGWCRTCPMAAWLSRQVNEEIFVGPSVCYIWPDYKDYEILPDSICDFVRCVDCDIYPALIAP